MMGALNNLIKCRIFVINKHIKALEIDKKSHKDRIIEVQGRLHGDEDNIQRYVDELKELTKALTDDKEVNNGLI